MATISPETAAAAAQFDRDSLGEKVRVHTVAKQLGVRASDFLGVLEDHGITGKKTASTLTKSQVEGLLDAITATPSGSADSAPEAGPKKTSKKVGARASSARKKQAEKKPVKKEGAEETAPAESDAEKTKVEKTQAPKTQAKKSQKSGTQKSQSEKPPAKKAKAQKPRVKKASSAGAAGGSEVASGAAAEEVKTAPKKPSKASTKKARDREEVRSESTGSATPAEQPEKPQQSEKSKETDSVDSGADAGQTPQASASSRRRVRRRVVRRSTSSTSTPTASAPAASASQASKNTAVQNADASSDASAHNTPDAQGDDHQGKPESTPRRHKRARAEKNDPAPQMRSAKEKEADKPKPEQLHPAEREDADVADEPVRLKGSTRLESQRRWRAENRDKNFKAITRSEFLARRESVERTMVVRDSHRSDHEGLTTQVGVVEDGLLVEHFVTSETQQSIVGNIYLGRVQNVLSSMEAAFIDIGTGRNAVLYAGEMNWHSPYLHTKNRRIDSALKAGDQIMVQVIKDPLGHKGARLTNRISFAGRYLVYFPGGTTAGISRKLPEPERKRLKQILADVIPGEGGAIIRTAAESVAEEHIAADVERLHKQWEHIEKEELKARERKGSKPITLYEEPNMLVKVVRDLFNEDFSELIVEGAASWKIVRDYVSRFAPELKDRVVKWDPRQHEDEDVFAAMSLDEQLAKALSRKVWLPSGGYLIIDHTEAMTVIDVNTGSFIGSGGNLEETVTQNNLEAAEEIVRQMRLRDLGGMIVVDFIDMVLEENQDLVLRRLTEYLGRDRTRHKVSEVTSLGLVQMTRKRLGTGLLETFATTCEACEGRGVIVHADPVEHEDEPAPRRDHGHRKERQQARKQREAREAHRNFRRDAHSEGEDDAQRTSAGKSSSDRRSSSRRRQGQPDDVAAIASDALRTAAQEDPDEPSGSDYVANEPQGSGEQSRSPEAGGSSSSQQRGTRRRRRVVKRVVRRGVEALAEPNDRQQRGDDQADHGAEKAHESQKHAPAQADAEAESSAVRKRRVRRVVRKRTTSQRAERAGQARAGQGRNNRDGRGAQGGRGAPGNRAQRASDSRQHGDDRRPASQTQEEFDNSPRRKRATRGNSRSDVPPQEKNDAGRERRGEDRQQGVNGGRGGARGRGRGRRVVRSQHK